MNRTIPLVAWLFLIATTSADQPRQREFTFDYGVTISGAAKGDRVQIWMPVPKSNKHQTIDRVSSVLPGEGSVALEPKYKNRILYRSLTADSPNPIIATTTYQIRRHEVKALDVTETTPELPAAVRKLYLSANRKVPIKGLPLTWKRTSGDAIATARNIYDRVDEHVRYDKSKPGYGSGDVMWVCDSRFGNCTDFHSLFISMARASGIPARFEIGFPIPSDTATGTIGGYHCWASFRTEQHDWVPVDISEADKHPEMKQYYFGSLTPDRVAFTIGRDIDLVPQQAAEPLNYFVYPHVEINGKQATKQQLQFRFAFKDVSSNEQN